MVLYYFSSFFFLSFWLDDRPAWWAGAALSSFLVWVGFYVAGLVFLTGALLARALPLSPVFLDVFAVRVRIVLRVHVGVDDGISRGKTFSNFCYQWLYPTWLVFFRGRVRSRWTFERYVCSPLDETWAVNRRVNLCRVTCTHRGRLD